MIEKIGSKDAYVINYTSGFDVKEYISSILIPKAFPDIPINKINLGFTGIVSEYISQAVEDAYSTSSLMINESFITKAVLPDSIYSHASLFDLGYSFAIPSVAEFQLQISLSDIINYSTPVRNTNTYRYIVDKDTCIMLGTTKYKLDYDIFIDHQLLDGRRIFNVYYNIDETNSISIVSNKYIKHYVTSIDWLILVLELQEFDRTIITQSINDNMITTNSEIELKWTKQIAGLDIVYISPQGSRRPVKLKTIYSEASKEPFVWYRYETDNTMYLSFTGNTSYWTPAFNSKLEITIYTCNGSKSNFTQYDSKSGIPVKKNGVNYQYNATTKMIALCYSGSSGGVDKGNIEDLRNEIILAYNSAKALSTEYDIKKWFDVYAKRRGSRTTFFKRRDDPSGKLFAQFISIVDDSYLYPTNTLGIYVTHDQFDYINKDVNGIENEFVIRPGHLWEYDDGQEISRDRLRMVRGVDGYARIDDEILPSLNENRKFMFVNPFFIKINRNPTVSMNYNYLINHTSFPECISFNSDYLYQFQLATFSIERSLATNYGNKYHMEIICVPTVSDDTIKYVEGIGEDFPVVDNKLRLVLIIRNSIVGECGYIEMKPKELRNHGSILFEVDIRVYDNIKSDMMIEVDMANTPDMISLITSGQYSGRVLIDSEETSFHFAVMMKDMMGRNTTNLFNNPTYAGYIMTNRFANQHRELSLYKSMGMMRSNIIFDGENNNYNVYASLIPFLKYDVPLDDDKMKYFIQSFDDQYKAVEPILDVLDGNSFLDFKLYNTYGRSNNYYIGPMDNDLTLRNSNILLDNVYVKIKLRLAVYDRSLYNKTVDDIVNSITMFFNDLDDGSRTDVHVSDLINEIISKHNNVKYCRFLGFNDYDANKQSLFIKYGNTLDMIEDRLKSYVPEIIRVDKDSIEIVEEI